jgi:hypothetical protein
MKEVLDQLGTARQKIDAATLTLQIWQPGDRLRNVAILAAAMVLEGKTLETLET